MRIRTSPRSHTLIGVLSLLMAVALALPTEALADRGGAARTRSGKQSSGHRGGHYSSGRSRVGVGIFLGYSHYYPYAPLYYPYAWGPYPYPRYYVGAVGPGMGGFDLNVKPKKTEVYLDGTYVGTAGKLDGFPSYLWISRGEHELIFHLPGYETVARRVTAIPGAVVDLSFYMVEGPTLAPEEVATVWGAPEDEPAAAPRDREWVGTAERSVLYGTAERAGEQEIDLRSDPARLMVAIAPSDASVYLDGRFLGTARELAGLHAGLIVDPGDHQLEVVRPGYASQSREFTVEEGQEIGVEVNLEEL